MMRQFRAWLMKVKTHLSDPHSPHRKIFFGFGWVSFYLFLGKIAGAAREMALAWRYGVSQIADAFVFSLSTVNIPILIWFGALTSVLLPIIVKNTENNSNELTLFKRELFGLTLGVGFFFALTFWLLSKMLARADLTVDPTLVFSLKTFANPFAVVLIFGMLIGLFSVFTLATGRHVSTLIEAIPPVIFTLFIIISPASGADPLVLGTVLGFAMHLLVLTIGLKIRGELVLPRFTFRAEIWPKFFAGLFAVLLGQGCMSLTAYVDQLELLKFEVGSISSMSYANRLNGLAQGIASLAFTRALMPTLSRGPKQETLKIGMLWARYAFVLGAFALLIAWPLCPVVVELLLKRGEFSESNAIAVTALLRALLIQTPLFGASIVLSTTLSSLGKYNAILISGVLALFFKYFGNQLMTPYFGIKGVAYGWTIVYAANLIFFWLFIRGRVVESK